jgi:hypothetical protein
MKYWMVSLALAFNLLPAALTFGETPSKPATTPAEKPYALTDITQQKFIGDPG